MKKPACAALTALLLAACGGGGGEDDGSGGGGGTPPPPAVEATLSDVEGMMLSVASARYQTAPSSSTSILAGQTIQLDVGALSGALNGQVQVAGETVTITNGTGTIASNSVVAFYEAGRSGDHAGALEVVVFDQFGALISENTFVLGIPTEDSVLGARTTGSLTYTGGFQANGILASSNDIEYEGTMTLTADFASDEVIGSLDGTFNGSTEVDMDLVAGFFTSNGFAGALSCSSGCSGSGAYHGAFYGPDVEEVGGVLTFDFMSTGGAYVGAGTFILDNPS